MPGNTVVERMQAAKASEEKAILTSAGALEAHYRTMQIG